MADNTNGSGDDGCDSEVAAGIPIAGMAFLAAGCSEHYGCGHEHSGCCAFEVGGDVPCCKPSVSFADLNGATNVRRFCTEHAKTRYPYVLAFGDEWGGWLPCSRAEALGSIRCFLDGNHCGSSFVPYPSSPEHGECSECHMTMSAPASYVGIPRGSRSGHSR